MLRRLIAPFVDAYDRVAKSVLDPVVGRLLSLSWPSRFGIVVAVGLCAIGVYLRRPLVSIARNGWALTAHSRSHPDAVPTLSPTDSAALATMRERLTMFLRTEIQRLSDPTWRPDPWALAQVVIGLGEPLPVPRVAVIDYFESATAQDRGWPQPEGDVISHLGASGWVTFALGTLRHPLRGEQYEFFLTSQSPEGWWPQFASGKQSRENASTYATAWQLLGLNEHLKRSLIGEGLRERVATAIDRGYNWLQNQEAEASASQRWTDYPLASGEEALSPNERAMVNEGVTSLVLYSLHRLKPDLARASLREFDSMWLAALPAMLPLPGDSGRTDHWVVADGFRRQDMTRHYQLQWMLLAMMEAYPNGRIADHVFVKKTLTRFLRDGDRYVNDVKQRGWIGGEFLYALNQLQQRADEEGPGP
jgi:hypothetical protein